MKLELITDPEIHEMVDRGIRGGICGPTVRKADANNICIPDSFDSSKHTSYISLFDFNALYSYAMDKKQPGALKDEMKGKVISEYLGGAPKVYMILVNHQKYMNKAKGTIKSISKNFSVENYRTIIENPGAKITGVQSSIVCKKHTLYTIEQNKVLLSGVDNKRVIGPDGITTRPIGYCELEQNFLSFP